MSADHAPLAVVTGPWQVDERMHAALTLTLPAHGGVQLHVSITALETRTDPVCSMVISCQRGQQALELITALRVSQHDADQPDLARFLAQEVEHVGFQAHILQTFVARMQVHGMLNDK